MEEAQRLLTVSVWKLYRCRLQRGGLRLHRSLQLSLLVRAARHRYLTARAAAERPSPDPRSSRNRGDPASPDPRSIRNRGDSASPDPRSTRDRGDSASPDPRSTQDLSQDHAPSSAPPPEPRSPGAPPVARIGRKRRSSGSIGAGPVLVPSKRARLEAEEPPLAPGPPGRCSGPPAAAFPPLWTLGLSWLPVGFPPPGTPPRPMAVPCWGGIPGWSCPPPPQLCLIPILLIK
uniref:Uncharacterized protein n=1 Tax=Amazona collaria TaxID=241587 RepID=A0A8B9FHG0_9PSIT